MEADDVGVGEHVLGLVSAAVVAAVDHVGGGRAGRDVDYEVSLFLILGGGMSVVTTASGGSGSVRATCSTFSPSPFSRCGARKKVRFSLSSPMPMISVPPSTAKEATGAALRRVPRGDRRGPLVTPASAGQDDLEDDG